MALTDDQVRRLARLARIAIRPEDSAAAVERLNRVLGLIDQLRAVDTTGIEPMAHAMDLTQRLRPDQPSKSEPRESYQKAAPAVEGGLYLVPKVLE
ncbi:MAG TPA: Asp-tRNA(Asn)/Glu-tRNA(Gln) amidotransferase subunit GatC [Burkholderiales bacterium]